VDVKASGEAGRCRFTPSKPVLKAPVVAALETRISQTAFNVPFKFYLRRFSVVTVGNMTLFEQYQPRRCKLKR
jgi:hypothetical protein